MNNIQHGFAQSDGPPNEIANLIDLGLMYMYIRLVAILHTSMFWMGWQSMFCYPIRRTALLLLLPLCAGYGEY